jgi:hypothetical protein
MNLPRTFKLATVLSMDKSRGFRALAKEKNKCANHRSLRTRLANFTCGSKTLDTGLAILSIMLLSTRPTHPQQVSSCHLCLPVPYARASNSADLILSTAAASHPQPDLLRYPPLLHPRLFVLLCCMMTRRSSLKTRFGNSGIRFSMSTQPRLKQLNRGDSLGFYHKNFTDQRKPRRGYHTSDTDPMQHYTAWAVESDSYSRYIKYS